MKVLSLFDGMSCGQIALDQIGIPVETYYASEIDKYAIQVTQANYPNTIQVGNVCNLNSKDFADVDLIMGGSPCQGFSFAGKQLAFDDPRSALFFEFIRLLKAIKPRYFLLENVRMKKEFLDIISQEVSKCYPEMAFGIEPILINSSLLSAQSRQRYYWTNIPNIQQPEDRGIVLRDILEDDYESEKDKSYCIDANYFKGASVEQYKKKSRRQLVNKPKQVGMASDIKGHDILRRVYSPEGKSPTLNSMGGGNREPKVVVKSYRKVRAETATSDNGITNIKKGTSGKSWFFERQTYSKDSKKTRPLMAGIGSGNIPKVIEKSHPLKANYYKSSRANFENDTSKGSKFSATGVQKEDLTWRKLSCLECERLQTVPDNYTNHVSNTQRYKMLGNGWTVEVIKHILKNVINNKK